MKIPIVLTSHDLLGNTGKKTGFWLEEFAAPYFVFRDAGVQLTLASPKGGQPPLDPKSDLLGRRGRVDTAGSHLRETRQLAAILRRRWPSRHRAEPGVLDCRSPKLYELAHREESRLGANLNRRRHRLTLRSMR
jgi:putative intracellular protease/amidase